MTRLLLFVAVGWNSLSLTGGGRRVVFDAAGEGPKSKMTFFSSSGDFRIISRISDTPSSGSTP